MYNGIGVQTAKGTGTSGHVMKSLGQLRPIRGDVKRVKEGRISSRPTHEPDPGVVEHNNLRRIEVYLAEYRQQLEDEYVCFVKSKLSLIEISRMLKSTVWLPKNDRISRRFLIIIKRLGTQLLAMTSQNTQNKWLATISSSLLCVFRGILHRRNLMDPINEKDHDRQCFGSISHHILTGETRIGLDSRWVSFKVDEHIGP
jgi:hypothetical protein